MVVCVCIVKEGTHEEEEEWKGQTGTVEYISAKCPEVIWGNSKLAKLMTGLEDRKVSDTLVTVITVVADCCSSYFSTSTPLEN